MSYPVVYIGSSCESHIGVGTLLNWKKEDVESVYFDNMESGEWIVELNDGQKFLCYNVCTVETSLGGEIEITDLYREEVVRLPSALVDHLLGLVQDNPDALPPSLRHLLLKK